MTEVARKFSVAPMMDWTDRHCRMFHRQLTGRALLYTEMVTAEAILHGDQTRLLKFSAAERPVALQLGGSDPLRLAEAAKAGAAAGYVEINLNVGCPSDRVQSGRFGACLMAEPQLVADCVAAMVEAVDVPITVKNRLGIDDQTPDEVLPAFFETVANAGCKTFIVHARKAWLDGLSPKQNRTVPPLDYELVYKMKRDFPFLEIIINGGVETLRDVSLHRQYVDGVMMGREAYQNPYVLALVDQHFYGHRIDPLTRHEVVERMKPYVDAELAAGTRLHTIIRHMIGLFQGLPGARGWRRVLSEKGVKEGAGLEVLDEALAQIRSDESAAA
jgi:tRNA-dihydrouridine synthase A